MVFFSHLLQLSCNSPTALLSLLRQYLRKKLTKRNGIKKYILTDYSKQRDHITVQTHCASPLPGNTYCEPRCSTVLVRKLPNTAAQQCKNEKKGFTIEKLVVCTVHVEVIAAPKNSVLCTQVYFSSGKETNSPDSLLVFHSNQFWLLPASVWTSKHSLLADSQKHLHPTTISKTFTIKVQQLTRQQ